ncbi:C80 family cysteine peptidase [Elioraea sp.]|jgi:hypothetical protein|uniref:C80 family cysteine peptidase n=1 Tax=Elioraea sp. TaxID=2185103 RepID=UPI003F6FE349
MIVVVNYEGESADSRSKLIKDAENIKAKIDRKKGAATNTAQPAKKGHGKAGPKGKDTAEASAPGEKLCRTEDELTAYLATPASKEETKLHVVAHGNQQQVGHYNAQGLANWLGPVVKSHPKLAKITLHACFSAMGETDEERLVHQFASALQPHIPPGRTVVVRGSAGESATDSDGHNWVLKPGFSLADQKDPKTKQAEAEMYNRIGQDRQTARPKYAIKNYKGGGGEITPL